MCGISGYINKTNKSATVDIKNATNAIKHRGPDAEGFYINENNGIYLGHRRLSILDLSTAANQPFFTRDNRYVIVYNGEIYNYNELKNSCHLTTKTTSDTEVIIEMFAQHGTRSFGWLNGMFAFAIYDTIENKIYLTRDRFGVKPLFYYFDGEQFAFASEIKALKQLSTLKLEINTAVFPEFLHLGFISQPNTIYKNVFKFPTGSFVEIDLNKKKIEIKFEFYWQVNDVIRRHTLDNEQQITKDLKNLLFESVEKQLVSDVPIGTFLSGGIDSSLVTAIASKIKKDKIKTFSIGYDAKKYDESKFAERVSKEIGTEHHAFMFREQDIEDILANIITSYDEPFADSSAYPTMLVSKHAREHVTVSLSGDGGDELFMGYGMYQWAKRLQYPFVKFTKDIVYPLTKHANEKIKRAGLLIHYNQSTNINTHIFSQEQYYFSEHELKTNVLNTKVDFGNIKNNILPDRKLNPEECQSLWDLNFYLKDELLVKVDRASMIYALESRVPFLDNKLVDYALNVNSNLKMRNGELKYILKKVLFSILPEHLFKRPKWGFSIPLPLWLKGNLRYLLNDYLNKDIIERYNIISFSFVVELKNRFLAGEDFLYTRLWAIIILHWWLEENKQPNII